jgi:hypothetical protein
MRWCAGAARPFCWSELFNRFVLRMLPLEWYGSLSNVASKVTTSFRSQKWFVLLFLELLPMPSSVLKVLTRRSWKRSCSKGSARGFSSGMERSFSARPFSPVTTSTMLLLSQQVRQTSSVLIHRFHPDFVFSLSIIILYYRMLLNLCLVLLLFSLSLQLRVHDSPLYA